MTTKHPSSTKSWIVYGPQACGKTRNAKAIANALKLNCIYDDWTPGQEAPMTDHLLLMQQRPDDPMYRRVMSFDEAITHI